MPIKALTYGDANSEMSTRTLVTQPASIFINLIIIEAYE
jgi:hypothetical protein